ncbi:MAG: 3-keto-disaccharide hydrolase [Verrucomicrobiota bacterium]
MNWPLLAAIVAISIPSARSAENSETFLDPKKAGPDYADQGEYKNDWGGVQVIALGHDEFRMVTFPGGLPGAGWDQQSRPENPGKREGEKVVFNGENGYRAELSHGEISIKTSDGGPWTMTKVERKSPTLGAKAPKGAMVLFDGTNADAWENGHMDERHLLAAGTRSKEKFTNFTAHLEFLLPFKPLARGQERGNSGVYLQDRYEVQVLDSFGLKGEDNECGGIYTQAKPAVNMCFPPLVWQTYDIDFTAAQFDADGKKTKNAVVTVKQNGVTIHDHLELKKQTPGGRRETAEGGALQLQGHGNPVFYRNIWILPK